MSTSLPLLLRLPEVIQLVRRSKSQVYRDVRSGHFPAPVKLGPRASAWRSADLQAWLGNLSPVTQK